MRERVLAVLHFVRQTLSTEERWTQRAYARQADLHPVDETSPEATCWCLTGALGLAINRLGISGEEINGLCINFVNGEVLDQLNHTIRLYRGGEGGVVSFNDSDATTWKDVRAVLDLTILRLEVE